MREEWKSRRGVGVLFLFYLGLCCLAYLTLPPATIMSRLGLGSVCRSATLVVRIGYQIPNTTHVHTLSTLPCLGSIGSMLNPSIHSMPLYDYLTLAVSIRLGACLKHTYLIQKLGQYLIRSMIELLSYGLRYSVLCL